LKAIQEYSKKLELKEKKDRSSIQAHLEIDRLDPVDHLKTKTIDETISKYDELDPIELPDEVLDNAYNHVTGEKIN
jgi:hypothetical protein